MKDRLLAPVEETGESGLGKGTGPPDVGVSPSGPSRGRSTARGRRFVGRKMLKTVPWRSGKTEERS